MSNPSRSLLKAGKCKSESYTKGTTYSLFGTIAVFNKMKHDDPNLHFEYVLAGGTAIAFHRNTKIFAWDSDSDIYLIFEDNPTDKQLSAFYDKVHHEMDAMFGDISRLGWARSDESRPKFHSFWVQTLLESEGYLDVFILSRDETKTKLRNRHWYIESLWDWTDQSIILPPQKNKIWGVYDFEVDIAANNKLLEMNYGNFMIPNVAKWQLDCPNVEDVTVKQWMDDIKAKYRNAIALSNHQSSSLIEISNEPQDPCMYTLLSCLLILMVLGYALLKAASGYWNIPNSIRRGRWYRSLSRLNSRPRAHSV